MMPVSWKRLTLSLVAVGAVAASVSGCVPLVLGGAAVGGTVVAIDRRSTGIQVEDEAIEMRVANAIREKVGTEAHVNVTSYNRQVLLTGEVPSAEVRDAVEKTVAAEQNVRSVVNDLAVMPNSTIGQRSNDTFITGKVRASLVDAKDLSANSFKVVTERNVVYLMGRVSQREAGRATAIARGITGVSKVVRVFEYLTEEEAASLNAGKQAKPANAVNGEVPETRPAQ